MNKRILARLALPPYSTSKTKSNGVTIGPFICPVCDHQSCYAYVNSPMALICNRINSCGARTKTFELFPELRRNIERDFPASKKEPHRPAIEYFKSRGLSLALKGLEPGRDFRYMKNVRSTGSGAVMLLVGADKKGREVLNGRLFNPPPGEGKTHNIGSTAGCYWRHTGIEYDPNRKTWLTEGIIDALSIFELGHQAIAVLAAGQDPANLDLSEFKSKVLAFDNDEAGQRACRKWKLFYPEAEVVIPDNGQDWNDLLQAESLEEAKKQFESSLPRYRFNGELALAESAHQHTEIFYKFYQYVPGIFDFRRCLYFSSLKTSRGGDGQPYVSVTRCLKASVRVISFILNRSNPARPEYLYNLEVQPEKGRTIEATATGTDLASNRKLNEWFLSSVKITWEGDAKACTAFSTMITGNKSAPEVKQLMVIGYQQDTGAYIFPKWAIDISGKPVVPDKRGFFQIGHNQYFRPPVHTEGKDIVPAEISKERVREIYKLIREAWGFNGIAALSWTVAGWFVGEIKDAITFYPFLSLHGEPSSGKSMLTTTINAIQGRDGEGLPITQLNSKKGLTRTIGQVSSLFTALLEDSERNDRAFDYSILLTAYNKGPLQVQAAFSNDLQTKENPFQGTLLFCQNTEPFNSKQEKQRVISLHFKADQLTDGSRTAYEKLMDIDKTELAGVIRQVLINRNHFKTWRQEYEKAVADLSPMEERRILQNHALILAFHRLFCSCFGIDPDAAFTKFFAEIGQQKCITSAVRQTTVADHFFELLDTLDEDKIVDAWHADKEKGQIFINLPRAENLIRNKGVNMQVNEGLSQALQKHPAYIKNSFLFRFPDDPDTDKSGRPKPKRAWVFSLEWFLKNCKES